jgi:hypothetical protein
MTTSATNNLPVYPSSPDLISHTIQSTGESPNKHHTVVFNYPDCTRTYDGRVWTVQAKPSKS